VKSLIATSVVGIVFRLAMKSTRLSEDSWQVLVAGRVYIVKKEDEVSFTVNGHLVWFSNKIWTCGCPDWIFRRQRMEVKYDKPYECKHIKIVLELMRGD